MIEKNVILSWKKFSDIWVSFVIISVAFIEVLYDLIPSIGDWDDPAFIRLVIIIIIASMLFSSTITLIFQIKHPVKRMGYKTKINQAAHFYSCSSSERPFVNLKINTN